jgi:predicted nucleic acid-binding protein
LIGYLDERDAFHEWASCTLESLPAPWLVCEPVLAEVAAYIGTPLPLLKMLARGDLELGFALAQELDHVLALASKYADRRMDLADACVVRMTELFPDASVYTVDRNDFTVYRRHGRQIVPCVFPD